MNLQRIPEAGEGTSFAATQTEREDPIDRLLAESRRLAERSNELTNRTQVLFLLSREAFILNLINYFYKYILYMGYYVVSVPKIYITKNMRYFIISVEWI